MSRETGARSRSDAHDSPHFDVTSLAASVTPHGVGRWLRGMVMTGVCTENLSSGVAVMKSAQDGARTDHTGSLNRARNRRILVQGSMRSDVIVIVGVGFQDPTQMHLAQDNDVVHTFTPDRSDQPFHKAILPRRGRCGRLVPDAPDASSRLRR
jgi:hypothetical protein